MLSDPDDTRTLVLILFLISLALYHVSEVLLVYYYEPEELNFSSFLISLPYVTALFIGLVEYIVTWYLYPSFKHYLCRVFFLIAIPLLVVGEVLRKAAWITARASFTHRIKVVKRPQHMLITHGVYAFCRHPGYLGWFIWAIATQLLLANLFSVIGFAVAAWRFFSVRIPIEEYYCVTFFGREYLDYRKRTPTRIPGIP